MARHGLILSHNEATGYRKVSRYLPDLRDAIKILKMTAKVPKSCKLLIFLVSLQSANGWPIVPYFTVFYFTLTPHSYTALFGVSRWDHGYTLHG